MWSIGLSGSSGAGPSISARPRYSFSSTSRNFATPQSATQELQPGPVAQPAVAVVAEDPDHALPDVRDLVQRHPDAEPLGQHRVGGQAAADPEVEAGAVLRVHHAEERDVVDLVRRVGQPGDRRS